jgi:glycosyltransferase involved in cell wall biosynthesis
MRKVSIVIPCFNSQKTIKKCIESMLRQSIKPYEIICVDDGSQDDTVNIIRQYTEVDLIKQTHSGVSAARNKGILKASGEVILFLESDGYYIDNYIEKITNPLFEDVNVIGSICVKRKAWFNKNKLLEVFHNTKWEALHLNTIENKRPIKGAWCYKKEYFDKYGLFDETLTIGEDRELFYRGKNSGEKFVAVDDTFYFHHEPEDLKNLFNRNKKNGKNAMDISSKKSFYKQLIVLSAYFLFLIFTLVKLYFPVFIIILILGNLFVSKDRKMHFLFTIKKRKFLSTIYVLLFTTIELLANTIGRYTKVFEYTFYRKKDC